MTPRERYQLSKEIREQHNARFNDGFGTTAIDTALLAFATEQTENQEFASMMRGAKLFAQTLRTLATPYQKPTPREPMRPLIQPETMVNFAPTGPQQTTES